MAERNVVWTKTADIQYVGILDYWVKRNRSSLFSKKLIELVKHKTQEISENPLRFKKADFENTRVAYLNHFGIYFQFTTTRVIITAF